jgi:hypothetical protein
MIITGYIRSVVDQQEDLCRATHCVHHKFHIHNHLGMVLFYEEIRHEIWTQILIVSESDLSARWIIQNHNKNNKNNHNPFASN